MHESLMNSSLNLYLNEVVSFFTGTFFLEDKNLPQYGLVTKNIKVGVISYSMVNQLKS